MQKLSIFVFCLFVSMAGVNAQEKTTKKTTTTVTTTKKTTHAAKTGKGSKATIAPPPPAANAPAPIPVPLADRPPVPQDPHAIPPPPAGPNVVQPPVPGGNPTGSSRLTPKQRGMKLAKEQGTTKVPVPPGPPIAPPINGDGHAHVPPALPGQPAPPRPYDPSVDNVAVGPNAGEFKFTEETHDFGSFEEGPIVETDFTFTNVGKEPITIKEAHGSCGCTVPTPPKEPILPGKTAKIHVTFNSKGRIGQIHKDITIVSNAKQQPMMLHITGEVKAPKTN